ncbi:hypothetical protein ASD50_21300 [Mesorhizobium sp. Root552]|nr:hypothetical protein ASD50_21300 [Mesorhizobium sp. Root552]
MCIAILAQPIKNFKALTSNMAEIRFSAYDDYPASKLRKNIVVYTVDGLKTCSISSTSTELKIMLPEIHRREVSSEVTTP